ncbi:MAG: hypothetical protein WCK15_12130 [Pirellula sp.]
MDRKEYPVPSPYVNEIEPSDDYDTVNLAALIRMKLNSFRREDQVHLLDMLGVGMIGGG